MSKLVDFSVYVNVTGQVELDDFGGDPNELTDAIFSNEFGCEISDVVTDPNFMPKGYIEVTELDDDEEDDG